MQLSLEQKQEMYKRYGTTAPDMEYEWIYNPLTERHEKYTIKELVDSVKARIEEIEAQMESIRRCREYNLKRKAEKERQIEECRKYNLMVRDLKRSGINVRVR